MRLAPVFYTLAQVQFNPIARMSDYVGSIQERLRRSGFPDFRPENQLEILVRRVEGLPPDIQQQQQMRWSFTNTQQTEGYLLFSSNLVFHTSDYITFEDFLAKTISGLELIHEIVELAYIERIGLRYLDAIVPSEPDLLPQYLNSSLLGFSEAVTGNLKHSFTETVTEITNGALVTRAVISQGNLALPPDLFPLQLRLKPRFAEINGRHAVLDTDLSISGRSDFDINTVKAQLEKAHDLTTNIFKNSVTGHARNQWD
jgi:uncharacterized protein (TIGR04255 family)